MPRRDTDMTNIENLKKYKRSQYPTKLFLNANESYTEKLKAMNFSL